MRFSRLLRLIGIPLTLLGGFGSSALGEPLPNGSKDSKAQSEYALWKIQSRRDPQNTVYLMGSVHVGQTCQVNSPTLEQAWQDAETVVFEVDAKDFNNSLSGESLSEQLKNASLPPGDRRLSEILGPEIYKKLLQKTLDFFRSGTPLSPSPNGASLEKSSEPSPDLLASSESGVATVPAPPVDGAPQDNANTSDPLPPFDFLDIFDSAYRPEFISWVLLTLNLSQSQLNLNCGTDMILMKRAIETNKPVTGLEKGSEQMALLNTLFQDVPDAEVQAWFATYLTGDPAEDLKKLTGAVESGDLKTIDRVITTGCQNTPKICSKLFDERNQAWFTRLQEMLSHQDDYLVVVGAGHLVGERGLLQLLKGDRYQVKRLN